MGETPPSPFGFPAVRDKRGGEGWEKHPPLPSGFSPQWGEKEGSETKIRITN